MLETRFIQVLNFQKSACLFTFISGNVLPVVDEHVSRFCFKSAKWAGNSVVPSLEVGTEAIALRIISLVTCKQIVGASGDRAPIRQQPWGPHVSLQMTVRFLLNPIHFILHSAISLIFLTNCLWIEWKHVYIMNVWGCVEILRRRLCTISDGIALKDAGLSAAHLWCIRLFTA